jgi:hypothetical protein
MTNPPARSPTGRKIKPAALPLKQPQTISNNEKNLFISAAGGDAVCSGVQGQERA